MEATIVVVAVLLLSKVWMVHLIDQRVVKRFVHAQGVMSTLANGLMFDLFKRIVMQAKICT